MSGLGIIRDDVVNGRIDSIRFVLEWFGSWFGTPSSQYEFISENHPHSRMHAAFCSTFQIAYIHVMHNNISICGGAAFLFVFSVLRERREEREREGKA